MAIKIKYNGSVIANLDNGQTAKLSCKNTQMGSDLTVTVPQDAEDSPIPVEVLTEAQMDELLVTSDVGSIFKYIGTGSVYENGALYVVEEEEISTYTLSVTMSGVDAAYRYYFTPDETPTDYNDFASNAIPGAAPYTIEGIKSFVYVGYPFDFNSSKSSFTNCTYENYSNIGALKITITGENASCNIWADD